MATGRRFAEDVEATAVAWEAVVCTPDSWTPDGAPGEAGGSLGGFFVKSGATRGFAKPSGASNPAYRPRLLSSPVAAHEKIAADLAQLLRLPVPPAVLWDRGAESGAHPRHCVISAVPFSPALTWAQSNGLSQIPHTLGYCSPKLAHVLPALEYAASSMMVFNTWLDNRDPSDGGNLLLHMDGDAGQVRCAYIDFEHCMTHDWKDGPAPDVQHPGVFYPTAAIPRIQSVQDTVSEIESIPDASIRRIVERIPDGFLNQTRRECILDGLLRRRGQIRAALERMCPAFLWPRKSGAAS